MCRASELGKTIVNICLENNFEINTSKLQKLLFILQGEFLAKYNCTIFEEKILAWKCGVAIKEVNSEYQNFTFGFKEPIKEHLLLLEREKQMINEIVNKYGKLSTIDLNNDIRSRSLWEKYYEMGESIEIPKDEIRRVFLEYGGGSENKC